jgi:hypothetical protein
LYTSCASLENALDKYHQKGKAKDDERQPMAKHTLLGGKTPVFLLLLCFLLSHTPHTCFSPSPHHTAHIYKTFARKTQPKTIGSCPSPSGAFLPERTNGSTADRSVDEASFVEAPFVSLLTRHRRIKQQE